MNGAHLHLVLNHVPVLGVMFGLVILCVGAVRGNATLVRTALVTFVVAACSAVPAFLTGEPAEHVVKGAAGVIKAAIETHEDAAKIALVATVLLGLVSLAALVMSRRSDDISRAFVGGVLVLALGSAATMAWTANLGGQIRHPEITAAGVAAPGDAQVPARTRGGDDDD